MPKTEVNYSKNIIYKIICKDKSITECYVGRTCNFRMRITQHKLKLNSETFVYKFIKEHGGWDNWEFVKIVDYPCSNAIEANEEEINYIIKLEAKLNTIIGRYNPSLYKQQWYIDTKKRVKETFEKKYGYEKSVIIPSYSKTITTDKYRLATLKSIETKISNGGLSPSYRDTINYYTIGNSQRIPFYNECLRLSEIDVF